jgi:hypothetical protein
MDENFASEIERIVSECLNRVKDLITKAVVKAIIRERDNPDFLNGLPAKLEKLEIFKRFEDLSSVESSSDEEEIASEPTPQKPPQFIEQQQDAEESEEIHVESTMPEDEGSVELTEEDGGEDDQISELHDVTTGGEDFQKLPKDSNEIPKILKIWETKTQKGTKVLNLDTERALTPSTAKTKKMFQTKINTKFGAFTLVSKKIDFDKSKNWQAFLKLIPQDEETEPELTTTSSLSEEVKQIIHEHHKILKTKISKVLTERKIQFTTQELNETLKKLVQSGELISDKTGYTISG